MKKTLLIAALSMAATPAFASKARLEALGNAEHVSDIQRTFARPYHATMHGEYATAEFGTADGTPRAEGGFTRQVSEGNYLGFYVNRDAGGLSAAISDSGIAGAGGEAAFALDNSFDVFYGSRAGDIAWGANLHFLSSNKKAGYDVGTQNVQSGKADEMALSLGAATDMWEVDAIVGLSGKASYEAGTFTGPAGATAGDEVSVENKGQMGLRGAWKMDNLYFFGRYGTRTAQVAVAGADGDKVATNQIELGVLNIARAENAEFFYGVSYLMNSEKTTPAGGGADSTTDTNSLPLVVGVEAEANSWMTLRGSVTHTLPFLSTTKTTGGESDTLASDTTIAAGVGMRLNRFTIDTLIAASNSGTIGTDGANFLSNASLTYSF